MARFLVTGGSGFIGAWICRRLLDEGEDVAILDRDPEDTIRRQVMEPGHLSRIFRIVADVTDAVAVERALEDSGAESVIHLAGLQVPACRRDPALGARVNIGGTINVLEAARKRSGTVRSVVYASSAAILGPPEDYPGPVPDRALHVPRTHYGVFKLACEACARMCFEEHGLPSVGLRPLAVYGVGRELGITSGPTKAIKAAVLGLPYTISFSGVTGFSYVEDVAAVFVACARARVDGAHACNLRGSILDVTEFVRAIDAIEPGSAARIRISGSPLPIAHDVLEEGLERIIGPVPRTPVEEGVRRTSERFLELRRSGRLPVGDLES